MNRFWLLGSIDSIDSIGEQLNGVLPITLQPHSSDYHGGTYLRGEAAGWEVIVQRNFRDEDGDLYEDDFPEYTTLVYVTQSMESERLDSLSLQGFKALRVEEL